MKIYLIAYNNNIPGIFVKYERKMVKRGFFLFSSIENKDKYLFKSLCIFKDIYNDCTFICPW